MKHKGIIIGSSIILVMLFVALATVLNKRWWAHRVAAKWRVKVDDDPRLMKSITLKAYWHLYRYGRLPGSTVQLVLRSAPVPEGHTSVPDAIINEASWSNASNLDELCEWCAENGEGDEDCAQHCNK